jgi:hypothetical protein
MCSSEAGSLEAANAANADLNEDIKEECSLHVDDNFIAQKFWEKINLDFDRK